VPTQNPKIRTTSDSSERNDLVIIEFLKQRSEASRIYNIKLFRHEYCCAETQKFKFY